MRTVETGGLNYPWGEFFGHLEKYAQAGDFARAGIMIEMNLRIDPKELAREHHKTLRLDPEVAAGLNYMLGLAYCQAEGFEAAYPHLKKAYEILSDASYKHRDRLLQQLRVIDLLSTVVPLVDHPNASYYTDLRIKIRQQLGLPTTDAKRWHQSANYAENALSRIEHISMDNLPSELLGLTSRTLQELDQMVHQHPNRKSGLYGAEFVDFSLSHGNILRILSATNPQTYTKILTVSLNPQTDITPNHYALKPSGSEIGVLVWDKGLSLQQVLTRIQGSS